MNKKQRAECVEELRQWLVKWTAGCQVQNGATEAWPCGTCACALFADLGAVEDKKHNKPIDRNNELWRGILQIREKI